MGEKERRWRGVEEEERRIEESDLSSTNKGAVNLASPEGDGQVDGLVLQKRQAHLALGEG